MRAIILLILGLLLREAFNYYTVPSAPAKPETEIAQTDENLPVGGLTITVNRSQYKIGEPLTMSFSVNQSMHVRIAVINSEGKVQTIFPNDFQKDSYCVAGQEYNIPPAGSDFVINVEGPAGTDKIRGIGSEHEIPENALVFTKDGEFDKAKMGDYKIRAAVNYRVN
jgi:Domain of unknown function (DUF4384)